MFNVKDKDVVFPGQLLGENVRVDSNCFREGKQVYSSIRGIARIEGDRLRVLSLSGMYLPKFDDLVVGVVILSLHNRWIIDINAPYECELMESKFSRIPMHFDLGDFISAKVSKVNEVFAADLMGARKLTGGEIIEVNPTRIPRLIGKKRSMLNMIKEKTNCQIVVGQNGLVWLNGDNTELVYKVIKKIENEAHTNGLTDRIAHMLDKEIKNN